MEGQGEAKKRGRNTGKTRGKTKKPARVRNGHSARHIIFLRAASCRDLAAFCNYGRWWVTLATCSSLRVAPAGSSGLRPLPEASNRPLPHSSGLRWKSFEANRSSHFFLFRCPLHPAHQTRAFVFTSFFSHSNPLYPLLTSSRRRLGFFLRLHTPRHIRVFLFPP